MFASALPKEYNPSEICVEIRKNVKKNTPDIIDHNLKKHCQILIIFGLNISDTTGY